MGKRYSGVREIVKGEVYEVNYQIGGVRKQYRIEAASEKEAFFKKLSDMADFQRKLSLPEDQKYRLTANFSEIWEKLHRDLLADKVSKKGIGHYRNTFRRMFIDFRDKNYPNIHKLNQLSLPFFKEYKNYYVIELNRPTGWRGELIVVKAVIKRLYQLGYCNKELVEKLQELKKPRANKKEFPDIPKSKIEKLFSFIRNDRPDYYAPLYFIFRTGRRRQETTLIKKSDIVLKGFEPIAINIRAETTKTKEKAPLACLDENLERFMRQALSNNKTEWLFPNRLGRKCTPDKIYEYLRKTSEKIIGIRITPHYFRHRFITECAKANAPIADVKAISGIKDNEVLLKYYSHSTVDGQKKVLEITRL